MKTVPIILPIYDSVNKQDQNRTGTKMPVLTPRFKLPSLLWNVQSDAPGEIEKIELVGTSGENAELTVTPTNTAMPYETFTTSGTSITSAINSAAQATALINSNFSITSGEYVTIRFTLTLNSGQLPAIFLNNGVVSSAYFMYAKAGHNELVLKSDFTSTTCKILIYNGSNANWSTGAISIKKNDITHYFNTTAAYIQIAAGAGWLNNATAYDTFTSVNENITSAIKTTAAGVASCWNVYSIGSAPHTITAGETIRIRANLTLNSGTAPKCVLQRIDTGANISNIVTLTAGVNIFLLIATSTITNFAIAFYNANGETCNWTCDLTLGERSVIPKLYTALTDDYFQYKGNTLGLLLPVGTYYLKITTLNGYVYYSDWFIVTCIYENLITSFTNVDYETFTTSGTQIISAIETGASGNGKSSAVQLRKGEVINIKYFHTQNSGGLSLIVFKDTSGNNVSNGVSAVVGLNEITLTVTSETIGYLYFISGAASNFTTSEILVNRSYSANFIKITFSDTHDLGEILYQNSLTQEVYFEQRLAPPTHEVIEVGEEKNGIFVAEKIITKYKYRIIANVGRELYKALIRLPQHDTISIIDEVSNAYAPKVGNVQVIPANWIYYDVCRLEIIFNDNTEYVWTSENNNIT